MNLSPQSQHNAPETPPPAARPWQDYLRLPAVDPAAAPLRGEVQTLTGIGDLPLFSGLPPDRLQEVIAMGRLVETAPGRAVATPPGFVYVVAAGEIDCFIRDAADKRFLLASLGRGDVLGELSYLVADGNDQKVELVATTGCSCLELPAPRFFEVVASSPQASEAMFAILARRVAAMNSFAKQVVDVDIDPARMAARTFSEKMADWVSEKIGSWRFVAGGAVGTAVWMGLNAAALSAGWDPYPFVFLNLVFSIMSAATMPVLLMSQNRQSQMDRLAARVDHRLAMRGNQKLSRVFAELQSLREKIESLERRLKL